MEGNTEVLECVICGDKLQSQDQHIFILHNVTQHTSTPLKDIVGSALKRKLQGSDIMCKKCLDLFDEKDRLQKMATDMDSHIMTKIKDSSKKISPVPTTISITVGETISNDNIKEELERQYKNISLGDLSSGILNVKELGDSPQVMNLKRKRGRPRKAFMGHVEESSEPPPLMVNQRQKRKRSSKFDTFLEVLKGEKDFYIMDDDVEEPKTKKRRGGRKKRVVNPDIVSVGDDKSDDVMNKMCIIQLTNMEGQKDHLQVINKDNGRLNLAEVVEEILGIDPNEETSLIHDIDHLDQDEDLIKVINGMNSHHVGRAEEDDIDLKFSLSSDSIDIKEEPIDITEAWQFKEISRGRERNDASLMKRQKLNLIDDNSNDSRSSQNKDLKDLINSKTSIEVEDIEVFASVMPNLEVTITQNDDNTLHAVVNNQDALNAIVSEVSDASLMEIKLGEEKQSCEKFRCKLCSKVFPSKELARLHAQTDHKESIPSANSNDFKCSECNRTFPTAKGRDRHHFQMHLKYSPVQCRECNISFNSFRPLERHLRIDHDKDPKLHCEMCEEEFVLENSLKLHSEIAHQVSNKRVVPKFTRSKLADKVKNNRMYKCPLCDQKIFGVRALKLHHKKVHNNQEYICKFCKYKSTCLSTYDRHMVKVHKASTLELYNCLKCKRGYQDPRDLEEHHISFHSSELTFLCQHCGEKFACMSMLRFHRKSHVAFSCKVCHLGFMKEEALEDHIRNVHVSDHTAENAPSEVIKDVVQKENGKENLEPSGKESDDSQTNDSDVASKILIIGSDGTVNVKEEAKLEEVSAAAVVPSEDVTLHLQQTREGSLEEMDVLNPLKGHRAKDLPKKMNCPVCNKVLTTKFLRTHMLSHKGERPHKCNICGKGYAQGTLLRKHMKNRHYDEYLKLGNKNPKKHKVTCEFCQNIYDDIYNLEEHLWTHMNVKTFECSDCRIKFGMESNLKEHYKSHYFKEAQLCPVCKREFKSIGYYNEHVEKCQKRWKCDQCGFECCTQDYYRKHQRSEHGGENVVRHQCSLCEKSFVERHRYEDHIITHSSEKAYICSVCNKQFKRQRPLNDHMTRCHSEGPPMCTYCRKTFSTQQELDAHKKVHRREFPCSSCGHVYSSKEALTNHLMVNHSEDNPHICHICGQSFVKQSNLKVHMITHNANTPNICPVDMCHKMFRTESLLRNHVARRHHELLYVCTICDRKFGLESDQIRHMATHAKGATFPCLMCGHHFKTEALLDRHVLTHTQEKPYECGVCQHTTVSRQQIIRHIQTEHGIAEAAPHIVVKRWRCSGCGKMFVVRTSLIRHLDDHYAHGVDAQGYSVKTTSSTSAVTDVTGTVSSESATPTSAFIDQVSTLSWQDITSLLRLHIVTDEEADEAKTLAADVWQCPGCLQATQTAEDMRDHLISTPPCQEAVILQMADGLQNTEELIENNVEEQLSDGGGNGTVLQLTSSEGGLQYVIVQEGENASKLETVTKEEQEENEEVENLPILVNMDDSIQQLLQQQPGHADIQIVVENSVPLNHFLDENNQDQNEPTEAVVAGTSGSSPVQETLSDSTPILNGSEVLLQTADGQLLLQQTVGGVTQYQLVEGVPTSSEEDESSLALIQSSTPALPAGEFIEELQSQCL